MLSTRVKSPLLSTEEKISSATSFDVRLYEKNAISTDDRAAIASFSSTYNVEEKHVLAYLGHLNDLKMRKDIRDRESKQQKKRESEQTYKDFDWDALIESGNVRKLYVRQLDLYLKKYGLTTTGLKFYKVKAIRCQFYRHVHPDITNELESEEDECAESDEEISDNDLVLADLDEELDAPSITFIPDEQVDQVVQVEAS